MLLDLPHDILLDICAYFDPADVLALRQTCRVLHAFACSDYVWHHLSIDFPLETPPDCPVPALSGSALLTIVIQALRLDNNWTKREPLVRCAQITKDLKNATIAQVQLLGQRHVLILSRWPSYDELCACRLDEQPDGRTPLGLKVIPVIQFAAATRPRNDDATVVFLSNDEAVRIYSLSLDALSDQPYTLSSKPIPGPSEGRISVVEMCDDIITTVVARIPSHLGPPTYTAIFYNIHSKRKFIHQFSSKTSLDRLQIKLYPNCFVLTGVRNNALVARIHGLPPDLYLKITYPDVIILSPEQCPLLAEHVLSPVSRQCEFYISTEPVNGLPSRFSLIVFHSFEDYQGLVDVYQVPIYTAQADRQGHSFTRTHRFKTATGTRPEIVCMGKTGYRAVWLDHQWESDEYKLWKATFRPGDAAVVDLLVPLHHPLPFEAHRIASLSFEEATGRVCVGLRTGAVYILEF